MSERVCLIFHTTLSFSIIHEINIWKPGIYIYILAWERGYISVAFWAQIIYRYIGPLWRITSFLVTRQCPHRESQLVGWVVWKFSHTSHQNWQHLAHLPPINWLCTEAHAQNHSLVGVHQQERTTPLTTPLDLLSQGRINFRMTCPLTTKLCVSRVTRNKVFLFKVA